MFHPCPFLQVICISSPQDPFQFLTTERHYSFLDHLLSRSYIKHFWFSRNFDKSFNMVQLNLPPTRTRVLVGSPDHRDPPILRYIIQESLSQKRILRFKDILIALYVLRVISCSTILNEVNMELCGKNKSINALSCFFHMMVGLLKHSGRIPEYPFSLKHITTLPC